MKSSTSAAPRASRVASQSSMKPSAWLSTLFSSFCGTATSPQDASIQWLGSLPGRLSTSLGPFLVLTCALSTLLCRFTPIGARHSGINQVGTINTYTHLGIRTALSAACYSAQPFRLPTPLCASGCIRSHRPRYFHRIVGARSSPDTVKSSLITSIQNSSACP